jgi:outer membrane protein assembly factor BamB
MLVPSQNPAQNWTEFRGPTGQGLAGEGVLPTEWSSSKNVAWKQAIPGKGWSSPIVFEGRVYLTSSVPLPGGSGKDQALQAICLDVETGKTLWEKEVFRQPGNNAPRIHGKNSHASSTPLVHDRRLYVHFGTMGTACLDLTGKILWENNSLKYDPVHGNGGSPVIVDDALIFHCDGGDQRFVVTLDKSTGKVLWKTERTGDVLKKFSFSTPLIITVNGQKQIVSPASNAVYAYDPRTGKEIWRVRYDGYSVVPRPVYGHGLVFISTGFDSPSLLAIRPDGQGDITDTHIAWSTRKAVSLTPSFLLVGDELYVISDSGAASCLDAKTGLVHWQQRLSGNFSASPLYGEGKIYLQNEQGMGFVLKAGKQYDLLAKNNLEERTLASYAASDGALFIRTEKHLYRIQRP